MKAISLLFLASAWLGSQCVSRADDERIPFGKVIISPDKKSSVQLRLVDGTPNYIITGKASKENFYVPMFYGPVYELKWSADATSVVAIAHAADGTFAQVVHWDGEEWKLSSIEVPMDADTGDMRFYVADWHFTAGGIKLAYLVTLLSERRGDDVNAGYYQCVFDADSTTGRISNVKKSSITRKQYHALRKYEK